MAEPNQPPLQDPTTGPDQPPLLQRARQARGLELDDLAAALVRSLGLPDDARAGVRRHYRDLERGRLDPADVAATVWAALAKVLGREAEALVEPPAAAIEAPALHAHADTLDRALTDYALGRRREPLSPDEVDRLFGPAPGGDR
jgi:hypothetical protein